MALYFTRARTGENTLSTSTDGGKGWGTVGEDVLKWHFISQTPEQTKQQYKLNPNPGHACPQQSDWNYLFILRTWDQ